MYVRIKMMKGNLLLSFNPPDYYHEKKHQEPREVPWKPTGK